MRAWNVVLVSLAGFASGCGGAPAAPEEPSLSPGEVPAAPSGDGPVAEAAPADGATSSGGDQVARGAALYGEQCAGCHGAQGQGQGKAPPVVGSAALPRDPRPGSARTTPFTTAADVIAFVQATMPPKKPGSLTQEQASDVVAFALHANGVDVSGKTIDPASAATIVLHP